MPVYVLVDFEISVRKWTIFIMTSHAQRFLVIAVEIGVDYGRVKRDKRNESNEVANGRRLYLHFPFRKNLKSLIS